LKRRSAEAMRRRPMSASPARPIPAIKTTGRVPAQYSPVCTLVTSGTAATAAGAATGVAAGLMDGDGGRGHGGAARGAHVAQGESDAAVERRSAARG